MKPLDNDKSVKDVLLKARQLGFTTLCILLAFDQTLWNSNYTAEFISIDEDTMKKSFDKVKIAWKHFALKGLFKILKETQTEIRFEHGSTIRMAMSTRGGTVNFLHVSELAKIARKNPIKAREILTGAFPAVHGNGRIIIESTAEGEGGLFFDIWNAAIAGANDFGHHFFAWFYDTRYRLKPDPGFERDDLEKELAGKALIVNDVTLEDEQLAYWRNLRGTYGEFVYQEYPSFPEEAFLASGRPVFAPETLVIKAKVAEPEPKGTYVMGIDVADLGLDLSVIKILDTSSGNIVYNWEASVPVEELAEHAIEIGSAYNYAFAAWESNGVGAALRGYFLSADYPNIYTTIIKDKMTDKATERVGFAQTRKLKEEMIVELKRALSQGFLGLSDPRDLIQLRAFQYKENGRMEAGEGEHDDRVMALAIANYVSLDYLPSEAPRLQTRMEKKLYDIYKKRREAFLDF